MDLFYKDQAVVFFFLPIITLKNKKILNIKIYFFGTWIISME